MLFTFNYTFDFMVFSKYKRKISVYYRIDQSYSQVAVTGNLFSIALDLKTHKNHRNVDLVPSQHSHTYDL